MVKISVYPPDRGGTDEDGGVRLLIQSDPLVWLYSVDLPSDPRTKLRVTSYPEPLTFERSSQGDPIVYSSMSVKHGRTRTDTEASVPTVQLSVQNVSQEAIALLETYNGLVGETVRIVLVRLSELPDATPLIDEFYDILDADATESSAEFTLGRSALENKGFPDRIVSREYCIHAYGSTQCGYDTKRSGALQTCSKRKTGKNGCTEHGDDEVAAGRTRMHPEPRFMAFQGVPRVSGTGVS